MKTLTADWDGFRASNLKLFRNNKGVGLIFLIIMISIASIVVASSSWVYANAMRQTQLRIDQVKAHYLAQAGVMRAVWDWYESNLTTETSRRLSPLNTALPAGSNMLFKTGTDSAGARLHSNFAYFTSTSAPSIQWVQNVGTGRAWAGAVASIATDAIAVNTTQGNFVVVAVATDGGAATGEGNNFTCADSRGNAYLPNGDNNPDGDNLLNKVDPAANNATRIRVMLFYGTLATALVVGDVITCSWTTGVVARAITACEFSGVDTLDPGATNENHGINTASPTSNNATADYVNSLLFGAIAVEYSSATVLTPTVQTPAWNINPPTKISTAHATATSNAQINPMYRIVSNTGNYAASGTLGVNRDWAATIAIFKEHDRWYTDTPTGNRRLRRWQIYNINNGNSITLDKIKVSWTGGGGADLNGFVLNGVSKWPGGTALSGDTVDITDTVLANGGNWSGKDTYLQWDVSPADPTTVTCQFIFSGDTSTSDAKTHEVVLWSGAHANDAGLKQERTFVVTSTGQVDQTNGGGFKVLKTVKATVSSRPGTAALEIIDWDEGDKNIP